MKELKEIRFNETDINLQDNLVRGTILPEKIAELNRNVIFNGNNIVEGAIYANRIDVRQGDLDVHGAVFAQLELHVDSECKGNVSFRKSIGSSDTVAALANECNVLFGADVNAKKVHLRNTFIAGSLYADEVLLDNCVVIGGVFASQECDISNSIIGTFNTPSIRISGNVHLLLPSAFSVEKMTVAPGAKLYNLSLADLGSLYKGLPENEMSGRIEMNVDVDDVRSTLTSENAQKSLHSYTVVGKVLAADLLDLDKFQNHFLLTAASLGSQLLKNYDLGIDAEGNQTSVTVEGVSDFFFRIVRGQIQVQTISGKFDMSQITGSLA